MKEITKELSFDELMEYLALIESLPDPWGRKGFFSMRIGRWLKYHYCAIDFHLEKDACSWQTSTITNSYTEEPLKDNIVTSINGFIKWYDKSTSI